MRFIVTCEGEQPSSSKIKQALRLIGLSNVSVVFVNNEGLDIKRIKK